MKQASDASGSPHKSTLSRLAGLFTPLLAGLRQQAPLGWVWRCGLAFVAAAAGLGLRLALTAWVGPGLPTYITFYPMVMAAALLAGFGPGLLATVLAMLATAHWVLPPAGIAVESPVERLGLAIFFGMGLFMSAVATLYRRDRAKAAAYDREVALLAERKAREAALHQLNRTLRAIGNSNQAMMRAEDEGQYLREVCRIVNEDCGHAMVWIGYADDDEAKTVRPVAWAGFDNNYVKALHLTWADTERGRGPTGTAIRTGRPAGCRNMLTDPAFAPWREDAVNHGYASSVVLPLLDGAKAFGAVSIYSREPEAFSKDETELLAELAGDLAHGISALRLRMERERLEDNRRLTTEALLVLNNPGEMASQINDLLKLIQRWGGYDAVALRLRSGEDFPYYVQSGFSDEFVKAENLLCARDRQGAVVRNATGQPVVECTCGLVLAGKTDPSKPFFTEGGSFWTNEASRLLDLKPAEDPRTNPRNRCIIVGHESIALIPLRVGGEIIGLLQLNDHRKGRFTPETIRFFEGLTYSISIALGRKRAEEELHQHREHLEELVRERTVELQVKNDLLFQAQKMEAVGRLAGGVAHDFNNLMTVVTGYGRRVLRDNGLDGAHRDAVEQMTKAGEQAANLTRQLLAFSRKQVINPVVLDLNEAVDGMRKMLPTVLGEDIVVALELGPGPWPVLADPTQIAQVIMNLAANARDAMSTGGHLTIRTANVQAPSAGGGIHKDVPPGRYALLSVSDTGTGMTEETRDHIFEPFFTTKGQGEGTGLGLSSVYGIVQQSGGHIRVDTQLGRGTTFSIYFPASGAEGGGGTAPQSPAGQEVSAPRGSETILLLEDEPSVCQLLTAELGELGYRVLPCKTPGDAIREAEAQEGPVDLLLSDVVLPGMSGPTLAKTLMERGRAKYVLFMSGHTEKHIVQRGVLVEGVAFIGKPFTAETLAQKIREVLDGK